MPATMSSISFLRSAAFLVAKSLLSRCFKAIRTRISFVFFVGNVVFSGK